ncbi:hypothetical protein D9615_003863 [Tricholomella constricta]|uniref:DUF1766-domain-containing protein n=1 Tax=Tricholomella constricta TaxID=117010 RepID=A0A8H5HD74_9AGAR|nr:hypothetical protein D9615_003863 [Tricholomella constricta]
MSSTKGKAKRFIHKLLDSLDNSNEQPESPPKPPSKPAEGNTSSVADFHSSDPELVHSFDALALSSNHRYPSNPNFVGGFHPGYKFTNQSYLSSTPSPLPSASPQKPDLTGSQLTSNIPPRPPAMPVPNPTTQSLTMQMALGFRPEGQPFSSPHPHSPFVLSATPHVSAATTLSSSGEPHRPTPNKPKRISSSSAPTSPSDRLSLSSRRQCSGVTKAGKRCSRQVKSSPAFLQAAKDADDEDSPIEVFCFQHTKELLGPSGYYARKDGKWVKFEDWIPPYLQLDTQVALRIEMEKARSQSDVPGYIYTFEIRDPDATDTIKLKVGRAVNLVKRIDQWGKQCGSKEQVLRGWYPGTVEPEDNSGASSLMKGRVKAGGKGAWCHRMERLIHLELADLAATSVYLDPAWPKTETQASSSLTTSSSNTLNSEPCGDCGSLHKEIFEFKKLKGRYKGKEWESVVQPVIQRWATFVELCV